jgi:hypothetical protein
MEQLTKMAIQWAATSGISIVTALLVFIFGLWGAKILREH